MALTHSLDGIKEFIQKYEELPLNQNVQHEWDKIVIKKKEEQFNYYNIEDIARMKAIKSREAGAWLNAFPSKNVGMLMDDKSFQVAVGLRLGCEICREFKCVCGRIVDRKGLHPLSCPKNTGRYFRHAEVNSIIKKALISADVPAQLEPTGLDRNDGKRPDGATIIPWSMGKCLVWDFTCSDTYASSNINKTKNQAGAAAEAATLKKHLKYSNIKARGMTLVVVAVETTGVWCGEGKEWLYEVGRKLIHQTGDKKARSYLIQRVSMAIQRGNATSVINCMPSDEDLGTIFYL